ncbi:IDEAL domain-containing protein [Ureibacillus composti]|uniref:IDEAL domain-containing protein n=1 Tax=Lysinibacillus composti TaxID=720633 RepID=A0A3N9UHG3_9BACI|nr:IDEAL domain-containing protein [Lysinibacillus composti]MBM7609054.1 hypothetical protein [Lysinibacillus composti]MDM5332374.1 IDEAL domain-containing protein [Ureibacillus composti]RQW75524.1 IDEAL domain-containing protein [Lysinibacillus composti]
MIQVQFMKPFYTKVAGENLRLVFAYQYFSIMKDNELYHFVPVEGKEIIVNLNTMQIENLSEIFVFQRGNRYIRMPLYQLLLISNVHEHLSPILQKASSQKDTVNLVPNESDQEIDSVIRVLEEQNIDRLIDEALANRDEELFNDLVERKTALQQ